MKNFLKNNLKLIVGFIIGTILTAGIAVYATINANAVDYTNNKKVSDALNELYTSFQTQSPTGEGNYWKRGKTQITSGENNYVVLNTGFKPNYIMLYTIGNKPNGYKASMIHYTVYNSQNSRYDDIGSWEYTSNQSHGGEWSITDYNVSYDENEKKVTFAMNNDDWSNMDTYWIACK